MFTASENLRGGRSGNISYVPSSDQKGKRQSLALPPQFVPVFFMPAPDIADKCPLPVGWGA